MHATALLDTLLVRRADTFPDLATFRVAWEAAAAGWATPIDRALLGGALADRLGYAFAAGYQSALGRLVPDVVGTACLCVTEEGGAHPRAIQTRLSFTRDGWRLDGAKRWATLAGEGDVLLVAATTGTDGDRNVLRLAEVPADALGVTLTALPPTPFTPEIPHYEVRFDGVILAAQAVLPGDGWTDYVKPFRTVEDTHVAAATAAYLLRVARSNGWPSDIVTRLTALILSLRAVAEAPADAPSTHVALAGCFAILHGIVTDARPLWIGTDDATAERWHRDAPILGVAGTARAARLEVAMGMFG